MTIAKWIIDYIEEDEKWYKAMWKVAKENKK